jgi:hypothetical protein
MQETYEQMMELYETLKQEVRKRSPFLYERWKAGGFIVDSDVLSMYPNLGKCVLVLDFELYGDSNLIC